MKTATRRGIAVAGTLLVDHICEIAAYPAAGELTRILSRKRAVGGCVPNVACDLKILSPGTDVFAWGRVGADDDGKFLCDSLQACGVDTAAVRTSEKPTSFTDVMSVPGGQRTFFTCAGACEDFGAGDADPDCPAAMLHLGYFLLLDRIDRGDGVRMLRDAVSRGIRTSIDLVSENSDRYASVLPALPFTDNLIINEIEAGKLTGTEPTPDRLRAIAEKLRGFGVRERVIIHYRDGGLCLSERGFSFVPSYRLPDGFIKGTTGAGDAFCAGALLSILNGKSDEEILSFAAMSATAALSAPDAVGGMRPADEVAALCRNLERKKICL